MKLAIYIFLISLLLACSEGSFTSDNSKSSSKGGNGSNGDGLEGGVDAGGGANAGNSNADGGLGGDGMIAIGQASTNELITKLKNNNDVLNLCQQYQKQTLKQRIEFPGNSKVCAWGVDGNLAIKNGYHVARYENTSDLSLPKDAVICSMKLDFPSQTIEYDDMLFLLFGDYILLNSINITNYVNWQSRDGLDIYSWDTLKGWGEKEDLRFAPPYCIDGPGSCSIPYTETTGTISLSITDSRMQAMTAYLAKTNFYQFKIVVTGDDNPSDCQHATIAFDTDVTYVIPK